jgi:hypothetical protein
VTDFTGCNAETGKEWLKKAILAYHPDKQHGSNSDQEVAGAGEGDHKGGRNHVAFFIFFKRTRSVHAHCETFAV